MTDRIRDAIARSDASITMAELQAATTIDRSRLWLELQAMRWRGEIDFTQVRGGFVFGVAEPAP